MLVKAWFFSSFLLGIDPILEIQFPSSTSKAPVLSHTTSGPFQTSSLKSASKDRATTLGAKWQLSSTIERTQFSTLRSLYTTVLATSATKNVSTHSFLGVSPTLIFSPPKSTLSFPSIVDFPQSATAAVSSLLLGKNTSHTTIASIPSASIMTGTESNPTFTSTIIRTPSIIADKSLVTTSAVSQTKVTGTQRFPTEETKGKLEIITEGTAFPTVTSRISPFFTKQTTLPSLEIFSSFPTVNQTISEKPKLGVSHLSAMVANITVTSFSPLFTALSTRKPAVKPVPSETTKTTVDVIKDGIVPTFIPVLAQPTTTLSGLPSTVKKETILTSSIVTHPSSSSVFPYSATSSKPSILSAKSPAVSVTTSPPSIDSKEFLQTPTSRSLIVLNLTNVGTTLYAQYPTSSHTLKATPFFTRIISQITTPSESTTLISISQRTATEYKTPSSLKTTEVSAVPRSTNVTELETTKPDFITEITDMIVPVPLVTKKHEPGQTSGYPVTLPAMTKTESVTAFLGTTQSEKNISVHTTKPTILLPVSISTTVTSKVVTNLVPSSSEPQVTTAATLHPLSAKVTFSSVLPLTTSRVSLSSLPEITIKTALSDTGVPSSTSTEFSSQSSTGKEIVSAKDISALSSSITTPSTTLYLAQTTVSPYTSPKPPEIPSTAKQPIETKTLFITREGAYSVYTLKEKQAVPYFTTKTTKHDSSPATTAYLTTKGTTTVFHFPVRTSIHPQTAFSTAKSLIKVATSSPFQNTSLQAVATDASFASIFSSKVPLTSEKEITHTSKADSDVQTTLLTSTRKATDLFSSKTPLFHTSKVTPVLLPLSTRKETTESFPTEQSKTSISTAKEELTSQTLRTPSILFPVSAPPTSPSFFISEAPETPLVSQTESPEEKFLAPIMSTAFTSVRKSGTETISLLSKQAPLSTISRSSFPASTATPASPYFTTATSKLVPLGISGFATESVTKSLAEKTAGIRESITTSLFSVSSVASGTKRIISETPATDGQLLITKLPISHLSTKHSPSSPTLLTSAILTTMKVPSIIPLVHPNATIGTSVPISLSTKPIYESATEYSAGLTAAEPASRVTASVFLPSREAAKPPTCVVSNTFNVLLPHGIRFLKSCPMRSV